MPKNIIFQLSTVTGSPYLVQWDHRTWFGAVAGPSDLVRCCCGTTGPGSEIHLLPDPFLTLELKRTLWCQNIQKFIIISIIIYFIQRSVIPTTGFISQEIPGVDYYYDLVTRPLATQYFHRSSVLLRDVFLVNRILKRQILSSEFKVTWMTPRLFWCVFVCMYDIAYREWCI